MDKEKTRETYKTYKELIKGKSDRQLMESIALNLKRLELTIDQMPQPTTKTIVQVKERPNILSNLNFPSEKINYYNKENREEEWDESREDFERTAEEISKDNDFFMLHDNSDKEKWVKKNFPKQKDVKGLVKRAIELYKSRVRVYSP